LRSDGFLAFQSAAFITAPRPPRFSVSEAGHSFGPNRWDLSVLFSPFAQLPLCQNLQNHLWFLIHCL